MKLEPDRKRLLDIESLLEPLLWVVLICCIARLWLMPLHSSFWVDEMATWFVVHHGADPTLQIAPQVPASVYYVLPALAEHIAGLSEISYRFFSVLAMAGALLLLARIAARLIHPNAAWFVVFAALTSRGFNYQAADARPYALGTLVLTGALLLLIRWLDSGRIHEGLLFAITAGLLWWVHMIFWPFYLLFALYAFFRLFRRDTPVSWPHAIAIFALMSSVAAPVAIRAIPLLHNASAHVVVELPTLNELLLALKVKALLLTFAGAWLLNRLLHWSRAQALPSASTVFVLGWWLMAPLALFAFSWLTGSSVFVPRYLYLALPGVALTAALLAAPFLPSDRWKPVALALGIAVLLLLGQWRRPWPDHHNSNWRAANAALNVWTAGANIPVICPSPFIEAQPPAWRPDYPVSGFLYSHLAVYHPTGHIEPFPFVTSPTAEQWARDLSRTTLVAAGRFAIYGGDVNVEFWQRWFARRPELKGWNHRSLGRFGDVEIAVFTAPRVSGPEARALRPPETANP